MNEPEGAGNGSQHLMRLLSSIVHHRGILVDNDKHKTSGGG